MTAKVISTYVAAGDTLSSTFAGLTIDIANAVLEPVANANQLT